MQSYEFSEATFGFGTEELDDEEVVAIFDMIQKWGKEEADDDDEDEDSDEEVAVAADDGDEVSKKASEAVSAESSKEAGEADEDTEDEECVSPEDQSSGMQVFDGYVQSIYNKCEPIMLMINRDPKLYKDAGVDEHGINVLGVWLDTIPRQTEDKEVFCTLIFGKRDKEGISLACHPVVCGGPDGTKRTKMAPSRLLRLLPKKDADHPGTFEGCWAIVDDGFDDAEKIIKDYNEDTKALGALDITGDLPVHMYGSITLVESQLPEDEKMSAKDAFETLLYTCKLNAMAKLQRQHRCEKVIKELMDGQRKMESIFEDCATQMQTFMLRHSKEFQGMAGPLEEIIGSGMGYTGLMYSKRFAIIITICRELACALEVCRDALIAATEDEEFEGYSVLPWNSKSQSSIYTKITDYADKKVEPQIMRSCGLLGIKDYVRTRLMVDDGKDARECVDNYLDKLRELNDTKSLVEDVVYKDKSFRFKPDGQAIYVTGYFVVPASSVFAAVKEMAEGNDEDPWTMSICKDTKKDKDWAMPFEIQVLNKAALDAIEKGHHSYEIERVSQRISAVCQCSKDSKGDSLPQFQCGHCMYRRSLGQGDCPFCHICFKSGKQQKNCTAPCCAGKNDSTKPIEEELKDMDAEALKKKVLAMQAELIAWRQTYGSAAGSPADAAKGLAKKD